MFQSRRTGNDIVIGTVANESCVGGRDIQRPLDYCLGRIIHQAEGAEHAHVNKLMH